MTDKIISADVLVCSPTRNFVTLKITTADGVVGYGDATLNGRELSVASYLRDHVAPLLIGRDATRIEDTWQYLYRGVYWRRGPVTMAAIGAVDVALWDIKGKTLGQPVYQLLGGAVRDRVLSYTHATGWDVPALLDSVDAKREKAFRRFVCSPGCPDSIRSTVCTRGLRDTSPRAAAHSRSKRYGTRTPTSIMCPGSSRRSGTMSAPTSSCCTTPTIDSPRSRPRGSANRSSR